MEYCDRPNYLSDKILEVGTDIILESLFNNHLTIFDFYVQRHTPIANNTKLLGYAEDILEGLKFCHNEGVIHSDIKLENILQCKAETPEELPLSKLCDFGLSHKMNNNGKATALVKCGTMGYMGPELQQSLEITPALDMWAFGITLYEMSTAYKPTAVKNYCYGSGALPFV